MVSSNKILTVSYGTFSCTLEGFDDSFGTMKAIAEYFRDLASDDRYFGAEPPTPDADMLARIAEREIARQVEARQERGQIVLRASEQEQETQAQETPEESTAPDTDAIPTENSHQDQADSDSEQREDIAAESPQPEVASAAETDTSPVPPVEDTPPDFDEAATAENEDLPEDEAAEEAAAPTPSEPQTIEPQTIAAATETESVAAKLRRIRAVVSKGQGSAAALYTEDEHAETPDISEEIATPPKVEATEETPRTEDFTPGFEAAIAHGAEPAEALAEPENIEDEGPTAEVLPETDHAPLAEDLAEETPQTDEQESPRSGVLKVKRSDFEEATYTPEENADDWSDDWLDDEESSLTPEEEEELRLELAQVEAELSSDDEDESHDDSHAEDEGDQDDVSSIFAADPSEQSHESRHDRIARRERLYQSAGEQDMKRLIAKTQSEMAEPQATNRRNAIAHLRAAVAATNAEIEAGKPEREDTISDAFRDDLASAVRPKRPKKLGKSSARRPDTDQSAPPLKLVAEQRIDNPDETKPVRPRRVSRADLDAPLAEVTTDHPAPDGFADFAAEVGAQSLGDILEAAAAYMTYVEEREDFSRPQLMTRLRSIQGDAFSREDGLRSFGTLLRTGKLRKVGPGRFTASSEIGFLPEARRVG